MSHDERPDLDLIEKHAQRSWLPPEDTRALVAYARRLEDALRACAWACEDLAAVEQAENLLGKRIGA